MPELRAALLAGERAARAGVAGHAVACAMLAELDPASTRDGPDAVGRPVLGEVIGLSYPRRPHRFLIRPRQDRILLAGDEVVLSPALTSGTGGWERVSLSVAVNTDGTERITDHEDFA
jgi:hypothetical protein